MERIHRKSALNRTTELILATHERGEGLLWERYEKQLPLCAFTGNGLNCRKCFQGPCRVSPFGDEPDRGVCGADRDQIVMENLFQDHPGRPPGNGPLGGPDGERGRGTPGREPGPFAQAAQGALRNGDAARDEGTDLRSPEQLLLPPRIPLEHPLRSRPDGSHPLRVSEGRQGRRQAKPPRRPRTPKVRGSSA